MSFYVIEAHNISEEEAIRRLFKIEGISRIEHVTSVNFPSFGKKIGIYLNIGSCLSIAKMFLNIPFFKVMTPFGLFNYLNNRDKLVTLYKK